MDDILRHFVEPASLACHDLDLVHWSKEPLRDIRPVRMDEYEGYVAASIGKPIGLWFSVEGHGDGWSAWCESENYHVGRMEYRNTLAFKPEALVLRLRHAEDLDRFTHCFPIPGRDLGGLNRIDWRVVARIAAAIIISPYLWSRRLCPETMWYYAWDCASGCVWDPTAIATVNPQPKETDDAV